MTSMSTVQNVTVIWPQNDGEVDYEYEHSIVLAGYEDCVVLVQQGAEVRVPHYALNEVIRAMRGQRKRKAEGAK